MTRLSELNFSGSVRLILFGAGGHARVVLDALSESFSINEILLVVDSVATVATDLIDRYKVVAETELESIIPFTRGLLFHVGIGDSETRYRIANKALNLGMVPLSVMSKHTLVSQSVEIGDGCFVGPGCMINAGVKIGNFTILNSRCVIEHDSRVGAYSHIAPGAILLGGATIGNKVFVGSNAVVSTNVSIHDGCKIGALSFAKYDSSGPGKTIIGIPGFEK